MSSQAIPEDSSSGELERPTSPQDESDEFSLGLWDRHREVLRRLTDIGFDLKMLTSYTEERARIEEKYSKSLFSLAQNTLDRIPLESRYFSRFESSMRALSSLKDDCFQSSRAHSTLSSSLSARIFPSLQGVVGDVDTMAEKFSMELDSLDRAIQYAKDNTEKAKQKYVKLATSVDNALSNAERKVQQHSGKRWQRVEHMVADAEAAEQSYIQTIHEESETLDHVYAHRLSVLRGLYATCIHAASGLHASVVHCSSALSQCPRVVGDHATKALLVSRDIDVKSDIRDFLSRFRSFRKLSTEVPFEPYQGRRPWVDGVGKDLSSVATLKHIQEENAAELNNESRTIYDMDIIDADTEAAEERAEGPLTSILRSIDAVSDSDMNVLVEMIKTSPGRTAICRLLNQMRDTDRKLSSASFDALVHLMNVSLDNSDAVDDCRFVRLVLNMAHTFYKEDESGTKEYLQLFIRSHHIWQDTRFWEAAFFDAIECEKSKQRKGRRKAWRELDKEEREESISRDLHTVFGQLGSFAFNMISLSIDEDEVENFVEKMCAINELSDEYRMLLLSNLEHMCNEVTS